MKNKKYIMKNCKPIGLNFINLNSSLPLSKQNYLKLYKKFSRKRTKKPQKTKKIRLKS